MTEITAAYVITTDYLVQNWASGRPTGIPQYFSSMSEMKMYMSDSNGRLPQMRVIKANEDVPDRERNGLICEERRWRRPPLDSSPQGVRIFE